MFRFSMVLACLASVLAGASACQAEAPVRAEAQSEANPTPISQLFPTCGITDAQLQKVASNVAPLRLKSLFWARDFKPATAQVGPPDKDKIGEVRGALGRDILERFSKDPNAVAVAGSGCEDVDAAMVQAAAWSLINSLRQEIASGKHVNLAEDLSYLDFAQRRACAGATSCNTVAGLVLSAQTGLLIEEAARTGSYQLPPPAPGAPPAASARDLAHQALEQAAVQGPSLDAADAWMVLAELDAAPGSSRLDPRDVRRAYAVLHDSLKIAAEPAQIKGKAVPPNPFRYRFLPIFQEAADEAWDRQGVTAGDGRRGNERSTIAALLEIGETARRAQIVSVVADACDPLQAPFSTHELRTGEVMFYPIVGARQTYLLVGRHNAEAEKRHLLAPGWTLAPAAQRSSAAEISEIADRLMDSLQSASDEEWDGWDAADAQLLFTRLIRPLALPELKKPVETGQAAPVLLVFPDPTLRNVPWALLHDGPGPSDVHAVVTAGSVTPMDRNAPLLMRSFAIAVEPGLAYVRPTADPDRHGKLFAAGLGEDKGLDGYVKSFKETDYLSGHQFDTQLLGEQFTAGDLRNTLQALNPPVVLLATDATFEQGQSGITVAGTAERMPVEDIEKSLREAKLRTRQIELLILVACEGAKGDAGDLGIAGAALRGGAISTLGTLVEVQGAYAPYYVSESIAKHDHDAALDAAQPRIIPFLQTYYGPGRDGKSDDLHAPAQALRVTQMSALAQLSPIASKTLPHNWGVFVLVGNWR